MKRTLSKVAGCAGETGLAKWEIKDSKLVVNYSRGCHSRKNSQSHTRVHWKMELEQTKS